MSVDGGYLKSTEILSFVITTDHPWVLMVEGLCSVEM